MEDWAPDPGPASLEGLLLQLWIRMVLEGKSGNLGGDTAGDSPGRIKPAPTSLPRDLQDATVEGTVL